MQKSEHWISKMRTAVEQVPIAVEQSSREAPG
jgi:hypothetical protein